VLLEIVKRVIRNVSIEIVQEIVICVIDWLLWKDLIECHEIF